MSKPTMEEGLYAPRGNETGTDFFYRHLAWDGCKMCDGHGEWHVPYEDYDTYIIHRCDCSRLAGSQALATLKTIRAKNRSMLDTLASGSVFERVDPVGTDYEDARRQAYGILKNWNLSMVDVLIKMITKIQKQAKSIEMFEYNQKWRKRRP